MRNGHYWKPAGPSSAPSNILVFDCETWHDYQALVPGGEYQTLRLGHALAYRLERGKRTRIARLDFTRREDFWALLVSRLDERRPLWVAGHNLAYDWGVVAGWDVLCSDRMAVSKAALTGQLFMLKGVLDGYPINLVDTFNYYRTSLANIGKGLGFPKLPFPDQAAPDDVWRTYCTRDVDVTADALDSLIAFVRRERLGPWQASVAGLAFAGFRSRFMSHQVLVHTNRAVLRMERGAYCGGIVDTAYIGEVPITPVYELDVCSMYPTVCQYDLPIRYRGTSSRGGVQMVKNKLSNYHVIADVEVDTTEHTYPVKMTDGTYYPTGRYRCQLATPELIQALDAGEVKYVHRLAWYDAAPALKEYMRYFVGLKTEYRNAGNDAWATLAKYYANNLYGKTGQLTPRWTEWGSKAMRELEYRYDLPRGILERYADKPPTLSSWEEDCQLTPLPEPVKVREYYGVVEVMTGENESRDSCPAIAATVTSYARQLLRQYQRTAGPRNWYYSDTDSIWTNLTGKQRLEDAGYVRVEELGYLGVKGVHERMIIHGPKDYETDQVRRVKGIKANATPDGRGGWEQLQFPSALTQIRDQTKGGIFVRRITKRLHRQVKRNRIQADGWTRPLVFPAEIPRGVRPIQSPGIR